LSSLGEYFENTAPPPFTSRDLRGVGIRGGRVGGGISLALRGCFAFQGFYASSLPLIKQRLLSNKD